MKLKPRSVWWHWVFPTVKVEVRTRVGCKGCPGAVIRFLHTGPPYTIGHTKCTRYRTFLPSIFGHSRCAVQQAKRRQPIGSVSSDIVEYTVYNRLCLFNRNGQFTEAEDAECRCVAAKSVVTRQGGDGQRRRTGGNVEGQGESVQTPRFGLHAVVYGPGWHVVSLGSGYRNFRRAARSLPARSHKQSELF